MTGGSSCLTQRVVSPERPWTGASPLPRSSLYCWEQPVPRSMAAITGITRRDAGGRAVHRRSSRTGKGWGGSGGEGGGTVPRAGRKRWRR